jgi:FAD/FMN-containing dehydrogenase
MKEQASIGGSYLNPAVESCKHPLQLGNRSGTSQLNPKCIFSPSAPSEVALSMKIITLTKSRFSIRSGGHNPNRGWSNTDARGLLIDLYRLNKVELSADKRTAKVGPGNRWLAVYQTLNGTGVTVLGGRTPDVGVGGVIIGGGIPSFSSEYGLVCDMVDNFEVVLADSRIVNANRDENPDLFWALKGGGANFGIYLQLIYLR